MSIITISRGSCSRGIEIAKILAKKLGYDCISRESLLKSSKHFDVPEIQLHKALEDAYSYLDSVKNGRQKYLAEVSQSFLEQIQKDNIVYHGFAGHFLTQGIPNIMKVRIIANMNYRVKVVAEREKITESEALQYINKLDSNRSEWSIFLHGSDSKDSKLYDVVLQIRCLGVEKAADLLYDISKRPCFQSTEKSKKIIEDKLLASKAYTALVDHFPEAKVHSDNGTLLVSIEAPLSQENHVSYLVEKYLQNIDNINKVNTYIIPTDI